VQISVAWSRGAIADEEASDLRWEWSPTGSPPLVHGRTRMEGPSRTSRLADAWDSEGVDSNDPGTKASSSSSDSQSISSIKSVGLEGG
jgi:hypothetical protein